MGPNTAGGESTLFELDDTLTVGQINRKVSEVIRRTWPKEVWVQGQIRNLSRSARGHVYFDLVDPVPAGQQPKASIAVTLFDSSRQVVNRTIKRTGNSVRMDDGVEVRIRATVDFYGPRGQFQLNMSAIDPEFTIGRLGLDRERLLALLRDENLLDANAQVTMPLVPLRIGLVTSDGSAAQADFCKQIDASGYAFEIDMYATRVQGEFAGEEISVAIAAAASSNIDVIAIVRGGGARTDLAAFDTEPVARAIAGCRVPVVCGVGHEIDNSIADLVAHAAFKTPTACAQFLIERVVDFDFALSDRSRSLQERARVLPVLGKAMLEHRAGQLSEAVERRLTDASAGNAAAATMVDKRVRRVLARSEKNLQLADTQLRSSAVRALTGALHHCRRQSDRLIALPENVVRAHSSQLDVREAQIGAFDPVQALRRGWSITTQADGRIVKSVDEVGAGDVLTTRVSDGTILSTVDAEPPSPPSDSPQASKETHD